MDSNPNLKVVRLRRNLRRQAAVDAENSRRALIEELIQVVDKLALDSNFKLLILSVNLFFS